VRLSHIATREAFENAILTHAAIGGSTNAVIHLLAIAGRLGVPLEQEDFDRLGRQVPLLVDLMPSGRFLMEDFCYAGGVPAVLKEMGGLLRRDAITVSGHSIGAIASRTPPRRTC
jgi:dihydroxy-acid dehydratase